MKLGVLCPADIAYRRFLPSLMKDDFFEYHGLAVNSVEERFGRFSVSKDEEKIIANGKEKAGRFVEKYGGKIYESYEAIVTDEEIKSIYIPLPPALHFKWAKKAMENGKHVLLEKPSTITYSDTCELIMTARKNNVAINENNMFTFHKQLKEISEIVESGVIGDVRLYRISFGFPQRAYDDFRFNKELGGGALLDAGGYTIKFASMLLGDTAKIEYAKMNYMDGFDVDMYGSGAMVNDGGVTAQISYGMDNSYKCDLEVWGSKGTLSTDRVLTAPPQYVPRLTIRKDNQDTVFDLSEDDAFMGSIRHFQECIEKSETRELSYVTILRQSELVDSFRKKACP